MTEIAHGVLDTGQGYLKGLLPAPAGDTNVKRHGPFMITRFRYAIFTFYKDR